jgi:hypothetical protein
MHTSLELEATLECEALMKGHVTLKLRGIFYEDLNLEKHLLVGFCKHGNETFRLARGRYLFSPFSCPKVNPSSLI